MDQKPSILPVRQPSTEVSFWDRHRLSLLLILTVAIAIVMTIISVAIYNSTGASQLDLSRPGYRSVSSEVEKADKIDTYSASGPVNKETINQFMSQYDEQAGKAKAVDAFNGDPLNPEILTYGAPSQE